MKVTAKWEPRVSAPKALTLDLDDTLWPIWPAIERAEHAMYAYLNKNCARTVQRYSLEALRQLRAEIADSHPHLSHDFSEQRRISLRMAIGDAGDELHHVEPAFEAMFKARNQVDFYDDALAALERLSSRLPIASLTNGNADIHSIGIAAHFQHTVAAKQFGYAKPDRRIFEFACAQLGLSCSDVLHIGDDPHLDVAGAARAGLRTCWINRTKAQWPDDLPEPDLEFDNLHALADWLEQS